MINDELHSPTMGNNLQALKTAKALTKQLSTSEAYLTADGDKEVEITQLNGHSSIRTTVSPSTAGVTLNSSTSHKRYCALNRFIMCLY